MYMIDANLFMNWTLGITLGVGAAVFVLTLAFSVFGGAKTGPVLSYLYMFSVLFGMFAAAVVILGVRGMKSDNRPWHFLLDMKYQPKYTSQGQSKFYADGRSNRLPPENTIPFDGTNYFADAGSHSVPNADFLKGDRKYYYGIANADKLVDEQGVKVPAKPIWKDGALAEDGYWVSRVPELAITNANGWGPLIKHGQQQFNVHCAACHGSSGRGGGGELAYGIVGAYGLSVPPASLITDLIQSQPDGQLYNTIANGKGSMSAYGHQVKLQDRWAIVAYVRVLQYAAGNTVAGKK